MDPRIGTEFAGYRIERVIGEGGASVVYLAEQLRLARKVALKILAPRLAEDDTFRKRFVSESRVAAAMDHPHIVAIYDAGEFEGTLYISMRHVTGGDLGRILRTAGSIEPTRAIQILSQIADALDTAHAAGMVHRDVKPGNVLVDVPPPDGLDHAYLTDFGISKRVAGEGLTRTGQFVGTVDYVAPEQITGDPIDGRTDGYSLGCVLFQCLSGQPPFSGEMELATLYKHLHEPPPTLGARTRRGRQLDLILAKALAKEKDDRYETCADLMEATRSVLSDVATLPILEERTSLRRDRAQAVIGERRGLGDAAHEVRKIVTILFCDVSGSTSIGQLLDPEALRRIMSRYFERMKAVLETHGGTVEKFIGDAVMAVFGVPVVHEDDALRACRAAMDMQNEVSRLNRELEREWRVSLAVRIGLNTGEVIAADASDASSLATGDVVNTAARLEQAASPGDILIGELTHRLARDAVGVSVVTPIRGRGKAEPIHAFRLESIIPGAPARRRRLDSPMIGRVSEQHLLEEALERAVSSRKCVLATVLGAAGIGKSRLASEFVTAIAERAIVLRGRCLSYGAGTTFWPIMEVIHEVAGITETDNADEAKARIQSLLPEGPDRSAIRNRVAATIGIGEATGRIQESFWALRKLLEAVATGRPLVVVIDDLHWAEPTLLHLIRYLEGWSKDAPILLLCLARSEFLDAQPGWTNEATQPVTVELEPLTDVEGDLLIQHLIGPDALSNDLRRRTLETAAGNPLFVEELLGMMIDEGRLQRQEDRWIARGDPTPLPTPVSVQTLLTARIEHLPREERSILQRASVIGNVFWWGAIVDLSPDRDETSIGSNLQSLVRKGLIQPDDSQIAGEDAFRFRHILIRDAGYQLLPLAHRAELHEGFASWMERIVGDRANEYEELLGYHLEQAYRQEALASGTGDPALGARASNLLSSAGQRALRRDDINAARSLLSRASEVAQSDDREVLETSLWLAEALHLSGDARQANELLEDVTERAIALADQAMEWRAKVQRAELLAESATAKTTEVWGVLGEGIDHFTEIGDNWGLAKAWGTIAWLRYNAGQAAEASEANVKASSYARAAGDTTEELWNLVSLTTRAVDGPTPVADALRLCDEVLAKILGEPGLEAAVALSRGQLTAMTGNFEEARASIERARLVWTDLGVTHLLPGVAFGAAAVESLQGRVHEAERELRSAYEDLRSRGANAYLATWAAWLARTLAQLGRDEEALALSREGEELSSDEDITSAVPWRAARALVLARKGIGEEATRLAADGAAIAAGTDWLNLQGGALTDLAEVQLLCGGIDESAKSLRSACALYEQKGNTVAAARANARLAEFSL